MRRKTVLLCVSVVFLAILSTAFILYFKKDTPDGCKTPFSTNARANIISFGDYLYYCDVQKDKALCSYHPKTQEVQVLFEETGELRQTITGIYYITNGEVYQITGHTLQKLYSIPNQNFDFIDVVNGSVYWLSYDNTEGAKNDNASLPVYQLCQKNPASSAAPVILWEHGETRIRDAVYYRERIYTLTDYGIYCTFPDRRETEKISDLAAQNFICSDDFLLFRHASGDSAHGYYEITEGLQTQQKSAVTGSVASICNGTLYYPFSETLWSVDLSSGERNRNNEGQLPGYPWSAIQATDSGVFLRCYLTADIWFFDFETGECSCIIPQQQQK